MYKKQKKETIIPIKKKITNVTNAVTVALNHEEVKKDPQIITKYKPFTNKYNWEGINFPSEKCNWKKFEKTKVAIALIVLYVQKEKIYPVYVSKHHSNREKQVIIFVIPNGEKLWHYHAVKKLSALLRGATSKNDGKNDGDFYCWNCLIPLEEKTNLRRIKRYVKIKIL